MSWSYRVWGTCRGITTCCTYRWNAHSFWPSYEDQACDPDAAWCDTPKKAGSTSPFDLTDFQVGHEVVMTILCVRVNGPDSKSGEIRIRYIDPERTVTDTWYYYFSLSPDAGGWSEQYAWVAIGVRPEPWPEIWNNSPFYRVEAQGYDGWSDLYRIQYYTTKNLDTTNVNSDCKVGYIWVEGEMIAFGGDIGAKIFINHDGSSSYVGTEYAGRIWIEDTDKLSYIDRNGYKRKTKRGDKYWITGWMGSAVYAGSTAKAGYFWVWGWPSPYWTKVGFVGIDGWVYRMGPGYLSGDSQ